MFKVIESKNCRKYLKRCYELPFLIDTETAAYLDEWGCVEILAFSKYSASAKDVFKINLEEYFMISGVIGDTFLQFVVPPEKKSYIAEFEQKLLDYCTKKVRS
jgi:hypothetical protein